MSATQKRQVSAYPRPLAYKKLLEISRKQGKSVSSILSEALEKYLKENP